MADIDTGGGGGRGKKGGSKTKKKSTRIDMTAMVDVAFLLLTFFVLTAVIQDYSIMALTMPPKVDKDVTREDQTADVDEEKVVTLILDEDNKVTWYHGITNPEIKETGYDPDKGVRKVIMDHLRRYPRLCVEEKRKYGKQTEGCWDPIFIIKPRYVSTYGNLVDVLDEMAITEAPKYAIDKFTEQDSLLIIGELEAEVETVEGGAP
jgi:hypothetical protein